MSEENGSFFLQYEDLGGGQREPPHGYGWRWNDPESKVASRVHLETSGGLSNLGYVAKWREYDVEDPETPT